MHAFPPSRRRRGFTMMEMLTVIIIIGILVATGVVSYVGARRGMEMRAASSSIQSILALARQHAVSKRRTTCVVFRNEGGTNCYYVFEKNGKATLDDAVRLETLTPPGGQNFPSNDLFICNMSQPDGAIGQLKGGGNYQGAGGAVFYFTRVAWLGGESGDWDVGDAYGMQVNEKLFLPLGIGCKVDNQNSALITFYANGRGSGVNRRVITLTDKMGTVTRNYAVYPLIGLVKQE